MAFSNSLNNSRLNLASIPFRMQEEDSTLRLPNSILLQEAIQADYLQIRIQAIPLAQVHLTLYQAINLRISRHHSSVQAQLKIPSSQHSSLVVYSRNQRSNSLLKVLAEASFNSLNNLDSKIQLNLEALVGCSLSLQVVRITLRQRYSALNLVLQDQPLEDFSMRPKPHQQVLIQVSSPLNQQQPQEEGYLRNNLQPRIKVQVSLDQEQVQAELTSSTRQ